MKFSGSAIVALSLLLGCAACAPTDDDVPDTQPQTYPTPTPPPITDELAPARQALADARSSLNALSAQMQTVGPWSQDTAYELKLDLALAKVGGVLANPSEPGSDFWAILADGGDIQTIAFVVMMEVAKSATEDLKQIMDDVKEINAQKEALRENLLQSRKALAALHQTLADVYLKRSEAGQSDVTVETTVDRFVYVGNDTLLATDSFAAGPVTIQLDCPNLGSVPASLTIEDLSREKVLASAVLDHSRAEVRTLLSGPTPLRFRAITQLTGLQETYCTLKITGRTTSISGRKPWTDEKRRITVGLLNTLTAARQSAAEIVSSAVRSQVFSESEASVILGVLRTKFNAAGSAQDLTRESLLEATDTAKIQMESVAELSEMVSLRLQIYMDRRSKSFDTLASLLKKMAETESAIAANIK